MRAIAHHIRLAALAAPGQVLETDRAGDDAAIELRQGDVHRQVAGTEPLLAGLPTGLVVLGADGLKHRDVTAKGSQVRYVRARLREACGIEDDLGAGVVEPVFDLRQAPRLLEAGNGDRQRVEPGQLQAFAEGIDKGRVGGLQVRAVKQQRHHGLIGVPVGAPILHLRLCLAWVVDGRTRQGLGFVPGVVPAKPAVGQAVEQVECIGLAALAQEMPEALGLDGAYRAQAAELRVRAIVARHQDQLHAPGGQLDQLLDTVAPIANATVQGDQDHLGVTQHLVHIEVDRGMVLHLHRVGQAQAGEIFRQLLGGFGQQCQV
ncbi:hypothetical protein D9M71_339700 [compost metagenome]